MLHAPVLEILKYTFSDRVHPSSGHGYNRKSLVAILRRSTLDWMKYREM